MKFLIHGYLGFKNLGDELILSKVIEDIRSTAGDAEIAVVTIDKEYTRKIHHVEGVVDRTSPDAVWEAVKEADVVVVGGGGLIQEYNDISVTDFFKSFGYGVVSYALVPFLAKILRKPVFYWSQGVGPIFTQEGKEFTRWFYSLADVVTLRDASSLSLLKRIYPEAENVHLDADPGLALDLRRFLKQPPINLPTGKKKIGLNIRPWFGTEDILEKVTSAIRELYRERKDFVVIPIPFDINLDRSPLQKALTLLPQDAGFNLDFNALETPEDVISLMNELDLFVGMRLHALIVSRALAIPSLTISYDVKTDDFSKKMGMDSIRTEDLTTQNLLNRLRRLAGAEKGNLPALQFLYQTPEHFKDFLHGRSLNRVQAKPQQEIDDSTETETVVLENFIKSLRAEMKERTSIHNATAAQKDRQISDLHRSMDALSERMDQVILEKDQVILERDSLISLKNQEISNLLSEQEGLANRLHQSAAEKDSLLRQLNGIYDSDFWKAARLYYRFRNNSRILKPVFRTVQVFRREGLKGLLSRRRRREAPAPQTEIRESAKDEKNLQGYRVPVSEKPFGDRQLYDLIFFGIITWDFRFQRPQQIATRFAKNGHRVFYLSPDLKKGSAYEKRQVSGNIFEITLPFPEDTAIYKADLGKGTETLRKALDDLFADFRIKEAVAVVEFPLWHPLAEYLRETFGTKIIFDCLDDFAGFGNVREDIKEVEKQLAASADLCLATARTLQEKLKENCPGAALVPNGTEFEHFHRLPPNDLLKEVPKPVIGYYGAIAEWFDTDLLEYVASERPHWSLVLIGHTFGSDIHRLKPYKNVFLLGEKPYSELPKFLSGFDVGIIPFRINELTLSTNPVKFYEFISSGKPVVATGLPELLPFADHLYLAGTKEDFLEKIETALQEKDDSLIRKRIELARKNDWEVRVQEISRYVRSLYPPVSVIVVTYNNLEYTRPCVESLLAKTAYPNYELIVVDNGSTDGTKEYLWKLEQSRSDVKIILNDRNLGFARANNLGIRAAKGDFLVFLNNDTVLTRGLIGGLVRYLKNSETGMVGPVTNSIFNEAKVEADYSSLEEMERFADEYTASHRGMSFEIPTLALFCAGVRKEVVDHVGLLDERYEVGMFEDDDYSLTLKRKGYRVVCARDLFIHHFGQASFSKMENREYLRIFHANKKKFEEKWGIEWEPHLHNEGAKGLAASLKKYAQKIIPETTRRIPQPSAPKPESQAGERELAENEANYSAYQKKLAADFHKNRYGDLLKDALKDAHHRGILFYPSLVEWDIPLFQRPHQIFRELAKRGYLILFLTPNPEADQARPLRRVAERIWVIKDIDMMQAIRNLPFILWISWTPNIVCREMFPNCRVVYDFIDELEVFGYYCRSMEADHQRLLEKADLVVTTADRLLEGIRGNRPDAILVPNGVCPEDFSVESDRVPGDLEPILAEGKPLIGYYGALAKWLDYDLIHYACDTCKDFSFVFIGPKIDPSSEKLQRRDNLFLLGPKKYEDLKNYLRRFDVATIPFQVNRVTNSTSPVKLFEYMAGGKPIVTTDMKECRKFQSVLISATFEEYVQNLRKALTLKQTPQYLELLKREAAENSWARRVDTVLPRIQKMMVS